MSMADEVRQQQQARRAQIEAERDAQQQRVRNARATFERLMNKLAPEFASSAKELNVKTQGRVTKRWWPVSLRGHHIVVAIRSDGSWFYHDRSSSYADQSGGEKANERGIRGIWDRNETFPTEEALRESLKAYLRSPRYLEYGISDR